MNISREDKEALLDYYFLCVRNVCAWYPDVWPGDLLRTRKKGGDLTKARHELAAVLQRTVGVKQHKGRRYLVQICPQGKLPTGYQPISTVTLGHLLGVDHSTIVLGRKRCEEKTTGARPVTDTVETQVGCDANDCSLLRSSV